MWSIEERGRNVGFKPLIACGYHEAAGGEFRFSARSDMLEPVPSHLVITAVM